MIRSLMKQLHRPVYERRLAELVRRIGPLLRPGDRVLDVGCGGGALGRALLEAPETPDGVAVVGLEARPRGGEAIEVVAYDGGAFPFGDQTFDVVIVADVLHHEADPARLLAECARVTRRLLVVKDHKIDGPLAQQRVSFIDWAANAPYGVPCLYRYETLDGWRGKLGATGLEPLREMTSMQLYSPGVNLLFGRRLQYLAVLSRPQSVQSSAADIATSAQT